MSDDQTTGAEATPAGNDGSWADAQEMVMPEAVAPLIAENSSAPPPAVETRGEDEGEDVSEEEGGASLGQGADVAAGGGAEQKPARKRRKKGWKLEVEAAQEDLPLGWRHTGHGIYKTPDGVTITSTAEAREYLSGKAIGDEHSIRITNSVSVLFQHLPKPPSKRPPPPLPFAAPPPQPAAKRGHGGGGGGKEIPSYLRARFQDRGTSLPDQARTSGDHMGEGDDLPTSPLLPRNRRRGPAELLDNNVLLFGQWYRKLAASKGGTGAGGGQGGEGGGQGDGPELSHLRQFVLDKKAYWGDEIALRVFTGVFKVVVAVVLQAEERLQVILPPAGGGADLLSYLVLTHRGSVPHYRGVTVTGKYVLPMNGGEAEGEELLNQGMVLRLLEDCPEGWGESLSVEAAEFMGIGKPKPRALSDGASGSGGNSRPPSGAAGEGRDGSPLAADEAAGGGTKRRKVVLCKDSLKEVTSLSGIAGLRESGKAQDVFVIDGFSAGTHFVERITCAPGEKNPVFSLSMTPGDGDCLFYALADVANEVGGQAAFAESASHLMTGAEMLKQDGTSGLVTADLLRSLVAHSLSETELAFFRAANNL